MRCALLITFSLITLFSFGQPEKRGTRSIAYNLTNTLSNLQDSTSGFTKLIFHTTACFGSCPVIHLEISSDKSIRYTGSYFKDEGFHDIDSARYGNFIGVVSDDDYNQLLDLITHSKITETDSDKNPILCCDGAIKTIILYQNGSRTYYKVMFESDQFKQLISYLYSIGHRVDMNWTEENFHFEK